MARPRTPIGTYGKINARRVGKTWEASTRFRTRRGTLERVKRSGPTKTAAENNLKTACAQLAKEAVSGRITWDVRFKVVAEKWMEAMNLECELGTRSPNTISAYRTGLRHILPSFAELQMVEVDVPCCDDFLQAKRKAGMRYDLAVSVRNTLSCICAYAVRHGALTTNPVRDTTRLSRGEADIKTIRALTADERADLFAKLDADQEALRHDLPDLLRGMLATALRISEIIACSGKDVSRDPNTGRTRLVADHRLVRMKGRGVVRRRRSATSTKGGGQVFLLPEWAGPSFAARKLAAGPDGPLFPNPHGQGWRDPKGYLLEVLRDALDRAGYGWVTSHVMRKTVATESDRAGIAVEDTAAQLGQKSTATTKGHYIEPRADPSGRVVAVLDGMWDQQSGT